MLEPIKMEHYFDQKVELLKMASKMVASKASKTYMTPVR